MGIAERIYTTYCEVFLYAAMDDSILASLGKWHITATPPNVDKLYGGGHVNSLLQSHCMGKQGVEQ